MTMHPTATLPPQRVHTPERRLKVCVATWAPFVGGAEVAAERLAVGLREAGHEVFMLLGRDGPVHERMRKAGLRCVIAPMRFTGKASWPLYWLARRRLIQILQRERPDVVHSNDLPTHAMMADAARRTGIPRICHHRFPFTGSAIGWFNKFGAERHLFVSRALMEEMCGASASLRAGSRAVVYDGLPLPPESSATDRQDARRRLGLPANRVVVLFAGQIIERKGVADLIRAWCLLPEPVRAMAELVFVGDDVAGRGAYRVEMEALARSTNCPAWFAGFQNNVPEWLTAADVSVVPSHVEPLGNATLEAMAHQLPVIGGDVGGIPEMVVHDGTGLLVPPKAPDALAGALARLILDPDLRNRFGKAGRTRCCELFSLGAHTRAALGEYDRVVKTGPGRGTV